MESTIILEIVLEVVMLSEVGMVSAVGPVVVLVVLVGSVVV